MTNPTRAEVIATTTADCTARVAEANRQIDTFSYTLLGQGFVVVSSLTNGRIAYVDSNANRYAVGMAPNRLPTSYSKQTAETIANDFNRLFASEGSDETMSVVTLKQWWVAERATAQSIIDSLAELS